jgi:hypothetical protein
MGTLEKIVGKIKVIKRKLIKKKRENNKPKGTLLKKKIKRLPVSKKRH